MKDPFDFLLTDNSSSSGVAPERLEMMGKQAASMYLREGISLNDAIVKLASESSDLENEHIKRVVEFANTEVFKEKFENSDDKNVHFPIADPAVVIRDLKDGGSPAYSGRSMDDYETPPDNDNAGLQKVAEIALDPEGLIKVAEDQSTLTPLRHANPVDDVYDLYQTVEAARDQLAATFAGSAHLAKEASEDFYQEVKKIVLSPDGIGFDGVAAALLKVGDVVEVNSSMSGVAIRLMEEEIASKDKLALINSKVGEIVNTDHPVVSTFETFCDAAAECIKYKIGTDMLTEQLNEIRDFIKERSHEV